MNFKKYLKQIEEETTSADIATVSTKLDLSKRHQKHQQKGKKCKTHKKFNCELCDDLEETKWN